MQHDAVPALVAGRRMQRGSSQEPGNLYSCDGRAAVEETVQADMNGLQRKGHAARRLGIIGLLAMACRGDGAGPALPVCTAGGSYQVSLSVGQYASVDPAANSGCVAFPANVAADTAEYVVVPQSASGTPGVSSSFRLAGDTLRPLALSASLTGAPARQSLPDAFHDFLRRAERNRSWGGASPAPGGATAPQLRTVGLPPVVGEVRQFSVCATITCSRFDAVGARVEAVGQRLAIFVDTLAPAGGLTAADLDTLIQLFDTRFYALDTAAFGRESDIDANTVVIVLMTNVVNQLVTEQQCQDNGYVAGFFFGADIDPRYANDSRVNHGEVFYSVVVDPGATLSCAHSRDQVKRVVPRTFVHEFQHMISFNQHVLVRGRSSELLWLNEALSHYAEENGGRSFLPGDPTSFGRLVLDNLFNAYSYLDSTGSHFLLADEGIGSLAERGAGWLFVRYLVDQFATDTSAAARNAFTRSLVQTSLLGSANVENATGRPFSETVTRWALANWVSDLPGFTAPAELTYGSWDLRATFDSLHTSLPGFFPKVFPLVPTISPGDSVDVSGTLRAGSGVYHRVRQPPGAPGFSLLLGTGSGQPLPASITARLNIIRVR